MSIDEKLKAEMLKLLDKTHFPLHQDKRERIERILKDVK